MARNALVEAIGTLHCPHCHMPLFASRIDAAEAGPPLPHSFVEPAIMLADDAFPEAAALIGAAEALNLWQPAAVVNEEGAAYGSNRSNDFILVTAQLDPALGPLEEALRRTSHAAARAYAAAMGHLALRADLGFQLLRYRPGQQFSEHVDLLPGPSAYGQRLVSALLYLNDDYEGGELQFPRQGLVYKPKAGSLILFPSGFCYPHASLPVRQGAKYAVATWFI